MPENRTLEPEKWHRKYIQFSLILQAWHEIAISTFRCRILNTENGPNASIFFRFPRVIAH
jgi:hypothetical protein